MKPIFIKDFINSAQLRDLTCNSTYPSLIHIFVPHINFISK